MKTRNSLKLGLAVLFALLLALSMLMTSCDDPTGPSLNDGTVSVSIKNGFLKSGKLRDEIAVNSSYTVIAEERIGVYFDGWLKNGEKTDYGETFTAVADGTESEIIYEAVYRLSEGATFEDVAKGEVQSSLLSGAFNVSFDLGSALVQAEVMTQPYDDRNTVLKFIDADDSESGAVRIDIASGVGDFLVYSLDFFVESFYGNVPLTIKLGNYNLDFYAPEGKFKICDSNGSSSAYLKHDIKLTDWHNIKVMVSNEKINGKMPHSFVFVDDVCVAESYNVNNGAYASTIAFSSSGQSKIVAYLDNILAYRTDLTPAQESAMNPAVVLENGSNYDDAYYQAELFLPDGALQALKEMDEQLFSEDIYLWIAELYDPETSAIYFSISGRDNYGYLPDIETVAQGYGILSTLGLGGSSAVLNDEQKANLLAWIQTLQSNRDGYYYHPHWGVSINNSRLSRDLGNSGASFSPSGSFAYRLFDDANYRLSGGKSGYRGHTVPSTYDNSLVGSLVCSSVSAVSKVVLAAENSSMPVHLRSEENLITYINNNWNASCKQPGTHERHFCDENCVLVENPSDSYMRFVDGKLVITRGYQCTSCHVCKHTLGHSYSFGHGVTSMGTQIKSAGLGDPTVEYFYDIQENVQASLRDKAQATYIEEQGEPAWNALSNEEKASIRKAAENGIWEEEITYNTISGLLKICGIPGTHGKEFKYAAAAIDSAIKGALFTVDDYVARQESIVSIYNPFNAINGIMNNVNNYGSDLSVRTEAMAVIRSQAEAMIRNTSQKLSYYLMPDGGYSYTMSGYCTHSQGQPVAIKGWNNGLGEGDVNGTALALGTRSALISCLGISVGAPFGGSRAIYSEEGYDLDCNGVIEGDELRATHSQVFQSIITHKAEIQKIDVTATDRFYDFEGADPLMPSEGTVVSDGGNKVLEVIDSQSASGLYTSFLANYETREEQMTNIRLDMKVIESNNTTTHQLFGGASNSLYVNFGYHNGVFKFTNVGSRSHQIVDAVTGIDISVNAKEWFTIEVDVYVNGKTIDGKFVYGVFRVTQGGVTQYGYLYQLNNYSVINEFDMYSLNSAVNKVYYDNVSCTVSAQVIDGEFHFDTALQKTYDNVTVSPTNANDNVYHLLANESVSFKADQYTGSTVIYNFDFFQGSVNLSDAKAGDKVSFVYRDSDGRSITGMYLLVNEDMTLSFYAANGQLLKLFGGMADMTLKADLSKWLVIKLEYHHDMSSPQFDIVVKYADLDKSSYNVTVASTLVDVFTYDPPARPESFTTFEIASESTDGSVYIDDLFIRNVKTR